jgi:transposase InsO family protein
VLGQYRSSQRHQPHILQDEDALTAAIVALARRFGRYGYRRIADLLHMAGWEVNAKRVQRIWRAEGLKVPAKQPKRGRLWLADGSCIRLRPERRNHVWAYDFVSETTHDGRKLRILTVIDEYTRECLAVRVARRFKSHDVLYALSELFLEYGVPEHIRSDNGPEFVAKAVRFWLADLGVTTLFIEPGSPWENGYIESFNGTLRDELLNGEIFYTLQEAQIITAQWRREYNHVRPHSARGRRPPAPEAIAWLKDFAPPEITGKQALALS